MRCDQYYGLNEWAKSVVANTQEVREVGTRSYADGKEESFERMVHVPVAQIEVVSSIQGTFEPIVANLHRYTMPTGEVYEEFLQAMPWSSGPCYFIALKRDGRVVKPSLWSRKQLASC